MNKKPPKIAGKLLKIFLKEHLRDAHIGDFEEIYRDIREEKGHFTANLWYWFQVFKSFPGALFNNLCWSSTMLKNYLKITVRYLTRHKVHSIINIAGLSLGLAACFIILLYVLNEISYDRYHKNAGSIYRVITKNRKSRNKPVKFFAGAPYKLAPVLRKDFPEVLKAARVYDMNDIPQQTLIKIGDRFFREDKFILADKELFEILSITLIRGNPSMVLDKPNSVVITEKIAEKCFGTIDVIGKPFVIKRGNKLMELMITGILEEFPENSHLKTNIIGSMQILEKSYEGLDRKKAIPSFEIWHNQSMITYLLVSPLCDTEDLSGKIGDIINSHLRKEYYDFVVDLQPLRNIYFHSLELSRDIAEHGNIVNIYIFSSVAFLIMLIACFNFIILSTARSSTRAKEIGIRKVVGAQRRNLIKQITGESLIVTFIALPVSMAFIHIFLPFINQVIGKNLAVDYLHNWQFLAGLILITLVVGIVSGSYIAIFLSKFHPLGILSGRSGIHETRSFLRKILIVAQITIFISLIICASLIYRQLNYVKKNDVLGYKKENLIVIKTNDVEFRKKYNSFKDEILKHPCVLSVSASSLNVFPVLAFNFASSKELVPNTGISMSQFAFVNFDFIETIGAKVISGRTFSKKIPSDKNRTLMINRKAAGVFGLENSVGQDISFMGTKSKLVGIFEDYHTGSLYKKIEPLFLEINTTGIIYQTLVRISPDKILETLKFLENKWGEFSKDTFEYEFTENILNNLYKSEQMLGSAISTSTILAVFIACLGLFGLSVFMTEQRTKEIGIRKIFGATRTRIITLVIKEYIALVLIANLIALPFSYYIMNKWLQDFAYKIKMDLSIFLAAGISAMLVALFSVSYQTIKAARANPVKSLRHE